MWKPGEVPNFHIVVVEDITERKNSEKQLMLFSDALKVSMDGIIITDLKGEMTYCNPAAEKMYGYHQGELIGKHVSILNIDTLQSDEILSTVEQEKSWVGEVIQKKKDNTIFPISLTTALIQNEKNEVQGTLGIARDISNRKQIEHDLKIAKNQAETANQAKSKFLANMSHEIRTPLNAIVGFSQILLNKARTEEVPLPSEFNQHLEYIKTSGQNLSELINNILDLAKIEAGKMTVTEEELNLKQLFEGIYHINKAQASEKHLQFSYQWDSKLPLFIQSDRTMLNEILMNLTGNAIKFTPARKKVTMKASQEEGFLLLEVEDEGIGILPDHLETIFDAFEQEGDTTTSQFGGTGLGLTITKNIVSMLNGTIHLKSVPGEGSVFSVRLPLKAVEMKKTSQGEVIAPQFAKDNVILMFEDNPMNTEMMQFYFEDLELSLQVASSGEEGIKTLKTLQDEGSLPDLILMDMHMPGMSGLETTKNILKNPEFAHIPIVILSADAFIEQQNSAFEAGVRDYLSKPFDLRDLETILVKYLRSDAQ